LVKALDLPVERGALVAEVIEGGPAEEAGLEGGTREVVVPGYPDPVTAGGDIVIAIDDAAVGGMDDIITYLQRTEVGQQLVLTILRDGEQQTVVVTLGERPETP
jgi:2-alkenal reductase